MENRNTERIAVDIDGCLADFGQAVIDRANQMGLGEHFPKCSEDINCWNISDEFAKVMANAWMSEEFWAGLKPLVSNIPFKVTAYITARPISGEVTKRWLDKHGFPTAEVITVSLPEQKLQHLKNLRIGLFIDDLFSTVRSAREAGINAVLLKAAYQRGHVTECEGLPVLDKLEDYHKYV